MDRIRAYINEAHERKKKQKNPWNQLLLVLAIVGSGFSAFFMIRELFNIQHHLIPTNTILSSGTQIGYFLMIIFPLFLSFAIGGLFANLIVWCIPSAREALDNEAKEIKATTFKESTKFISILIIVLLAVFTPLIFAGVFNYFYVTPNGVAIRSIFTIKEKHYNWSDIIKVHTESYTTSSSIQLKYVLYMKDGTKFNILVDHYASFADAYLKMKPYLKSQKNIVYEVGRMDEPGMRKYLLDYYADRLIKVLENGE